MKIIYQGTDSLFLVRFPKQLRWTKIFYVVALRVFAKIADIFTQEYYVCGQRVEANIKKFGLKKKTVQFKDMLLYPTKIAKKKHDGFNVLYYYPQRNTKFNRWLYGADIFSQVKLSLPEVNFIVVDGYADMKKVYPIVDFMIRPTRHDGHPRMVDECELNDIPYYWSTDGEPNVKEIQQTIKNEYANWLLR
jgi:hypothetical protein